MKKSTLLKIAEIITFLDVSYTVQGNSYIFACNEEQYIKLSKALLFYCTEFRIHPTVPADDHFEVIYIEIPFDKIIS